MKKIYWFSFIILISFVWTQCQFKTKELIEIPEKPYEKLSEYHFFKGNLSDLEPNDGVLPYDLNTPLFSDYAHKARFVWLPEGTSAQYDTSHVIDFPVGSVLIKNFFYHKDERDPTLGRNVIETRILINRGEEWQALGYIWNDDQSEAFYKVGGDIKQVAWIDAHGISRQVDYIIPNKNQCKGCHAYNDVQMPIGPKIRNLNKSFAYSDGSANQLDKWASVGYLTGFTPGYAHPKVAIWDDSTSGSLEARARAYLDINCGHCHNRNGAANTSGLYLTANAKHDISLGIFKPTISAGTGTGGLTYSIVPGHPDASILVYRMNSTDPGAMMPELGRRLVHSEGVQLIRNWIGTMETK